MVFHVDLLEIIALGILALCGFGALIYVAIQEKKDKKK